VVSVTNIFIIKGNPGDLYAVQNVPRGTDGQPLQGMVQPKTSYELAFPDIVKFVEGNYRVIKRKSARAIAGLSMGGGHSLNMAINTSISRTKADTSGATGASTYRCLHRCYSGNILTLRFFIVFFFLFTHYSSPLQHISLQSRIHFPLT
jgi:hypothetical protein